MNNRPPEPLTALTAKTGGHTDRARSHAIVRGAPGPFKGLESTIPRPLIGLLYIRRKRGYFRLFIHFRGATSHYKLKDVLSEGLLLSYCI